MSSRNTPLGASVLALALCGCGDMGGGVNSASSTPVAPTPTPTPTPAPASATSVSIFANPKVGDFASVGVSAPATEMGGDSAKKIGALSSADTDQVHIRYTNAGTYQIQMPGGPYETLVFAKNAIPQDPQYFNYFQPQSAAINGPFLVTSISKTQGYSYSELATWWDEKRLGVVAFGMATPAGQVPVSGTATYHGSLMGTSDVIGFNSFDGHYNVPVTGSVDLSFDFGKSTLAGAMTVSLNDYTPMPLGTFAFANTTYGSGGLTYSGTFQTGVSGQNFFLGRFAGPNAEETIGGWALPFNYSGDGQTHQAFGAWIAKKP